MNINWVESHVEAEPPKKPKKITGTKFPIVIGKSPWNTPFTMWCALTRLWEEPFEGNKYTEAGQAIEPKQLDYLRDAYLMDNIVRPTDLYGPDPFKTTWGDFFKNEPVFGGMWDSILVDESGQPEGVIECKTTKRAEDWLQGAPDDKALQGALYAWLLKREYNLEVAPRVLMVGTFLEDKDYENPQGFSCSAANTTIDEFEVLDRYPNFPQTFREVEDWFDSYVKTGVSPDYDEKKDKMALDALRTASPKIDEDATSLLSRADVLMSLVEENEKKMKATADELEGIKKSLKKFLESNMVSGEKKATVAGKLYRWKLSTGTKVEIDKDALSADGLLDKYSKKSVISRLTTERMDA